MAYLKGIGSVDEARVFLLLRISCILIFLGRAYQYLFWDIPYRVLLWDEKLMTPFVERVLGRTWKDYATDLSVSESIQLFGKSVGVFWLLCALGLIFIKYLNRSLVKIILSLGILFLLLHAVLETKDRFYHLAQFFEHGIQIGAPFLYLLFWLNKITKPKLFLGLRWIIAMTFVAHGLYALGVYPVPGHFVDMTIKSLGMTEDVAKIYLFVAGVLDLCVGIAVFIPSLMAPALIYAFTWGILTALARMVAGFNLDFLATSFHQYTYQTVFRLAHGLIPLTAYLLRKHLP